MKKITLLALFLTTTFIFSATITGLVPIPDEWNDEPEPTFSEQEHLAIQAVIIDHLSALRLGDGVAAFATLSPPTQELFQTPERFLFLMQREFPLLCTIHEIRFLKLMVLNGEVVEAFTIQGSDGLPISGLIVMDQLPNDTWRINSIGLLLQKINGI